MNSRAIALMQQADREEERLQQHLPVAAMLRGNRSLEVVQYAKTQVEKWRQQRLCSQDYIDCWADLLNDPLRAAAVLEERSALGRSLRQNTPFAAFLR